MPPQDLGSLEGFIRAVVSECEPCMQNTAPDNLGFGWLYYGMIRNLQPEFVVAIGSRRGFMPFCAARAVKDNGRGRVFFIDPGYVGSDHPGWAGIGFWADADRVRTWIDKFDLAGCIEHLPMKSCDAVAVIRERVGPAGLGVVIVDGDHTYSGCLADYELYSELIANGGFIMFHDAISPWCDVPKALQHLRSRGIPMLTIRKEVGLAIAEVQKPASVADTWGYLLRPSNRGNLIADLLAPALRSDDHVLEMHCGLSPLPDLMSVGSWWGYDVDPQVINSARARYPTHTWEVVDERLLQLANLPSRSTVLIGLGLVRGHCSWDAQHVFDNACYLLGRYAPRVCAFEAAEEYYSADILDDLGALLQAHKYTLADHRLQTDLTAFSGRRLLLGQRT